MANGTNTFSSSSSLLFLSASFLFINLLLHILFHSTHALDELAATTTTDSSSSSSNNDHYYLMQRQRQLQRQQPPLLSQRNIPEQLMNPVVRSQIRQRLLKLKMQKDLLLRQQTDRDGMPPTLPLPSSSASSASSSSGELLAGNVPFHNRNCFFSPINCHLPVIGLRQTMKRRQPPVVAASYYKLSNQQMAQQGEEEEDDEEHQQQRQQPQRKIRERRLAQYILATINGRSPTTYYSSRNDQ